MGHPFLPAAQHERRFPFRSFCSRDTARKPDDGVSALDYIFCEDGHADRHPGLPAMVPPGFELTTAGRLQALERTQPNLEHGSNAIAMLSSACVVNGMVFNDGGGVKPFIVKKVESAPFIQAIRVWSVPDEPVPVGRL